MYALVWSAGLGKVEGLEGLAGAGLGLVGLRLGGLARLRLRGRDRRVAVLLLPPGLGPARVVRLLLLEALHRRRLPLLDVGGGLVGALHVLVALHPVLLDLAARHRGALRLLRPVLAGLAPRPRLVGALEGQLLRGRLLLALVGAEARLGLAGGHVAGGAGAVGVASAPLSASLGRLLLPTAAGGPTGSGGAVLVLVLQLLVELVREEVVARRGPVVLARLVVVAIVGVDARAAQLLRVLRYPRRRLLRRAQPVLQRGLQIISSNSIVALDSLKATSREIMHADKLSLKSYYRDSFLE